MLIFAQTFPVDIDECLEENKCDKKTERCVNKPGSLVCVCKQGYRRQMQNCIKDTGVKKKRNTEDKNKSPGDLLERIKASLSGLGLKMVTLLYALMLCGLYFLFQQRSWVRFACVVALCGFILFFNKNF